MYNLNDYSITEAIKIEEAIEEVVKGVSLLSDSAEELEKLADAPEDNNDECLLVAVGMELVALRLNEHLAVLYSYGDENLIHMAVQKVRESHVGREFYLLVAMNILGVSGK